MRTLGPATVLAIGAVSPAMASGPAVEVPFIIDRVQRKDPKSGDWRDTVHLIDLADPANEGSR